MVVEVVAMLYAVQSEGHTPGSNSKVPTQVEVGAKGSTLELGSLRLGMQWLPTSVGFIWRYEQVGSKETTFCH